MLLTWHLGVGYLTLNPQQYSPILNTQYSILIHSTFYTQHSTTLFTSEYTMLYTIYSIICALYSILCALCSITHSCQRKATLGLLYWSPLRKGPIKALLVFWGPIQNKGNKEEENIYIYIFWEEKKQWCMVLHKFYFIVQIYFKIPLGPTKKYTMYIFLDIWQNGRQMRRPIQWNWYWQLCILYTLYQGLRTLDSRIWN